MRKLTEYDRKRIFAYIQQEQELNQLFYSAIEQYGVSSEKVSVYAKEAETRGEKMVQADFPLDYEELWECLVLQYYDDYLVYSPENEIPILKLKEFFDERQVDCIRGKIAHVKAFQHVYPDRVLKENNLCKLDRTKWENSEEARNGYHTCKKEIQVKRLYVADISQMMELYLSVKEFARTFRYAEKSEQKMKKELEKGELAVGIYEEERLVSVARTNCSNSKGANVVCVATNPKYRGKGYASLAVKALCDLAFENEIPMLCLYYSDPVAGKIYEKIGFQIVGDYAMLR